LSNYFAQLLNFLPCLDLLLQQLVPFLQFNHNLLLNALNLAVYSVQTAVVIRRAALSVRPSQLLLPKRFNRALPQLLLLQFNFVLHILNRLAHTI